MTSKTVLVALLSALVAVQATGRTTLQSPPEGTDDFANTESRALRGTCSGQPTFQADSECCTRWQKCTTDTCAGNSVGAITFECTGTGATASFSSCQCSTVQDPSARPSATVITALEEQFKAYFGLAVASSPDYAAQKAKCLAQPYIAGTFTLASALPDEFAAALTTAKCVKSYATWMYKGDACNIALLVPVDTDCAGGISKVTYNTDGTWSALDGVFPSTEFGSVRFNASRLASATTADVTIADKYNAKYEVSAGLRRPVNAAGLASFSPLTTILSLLAAILLANML